MARLMAAFATALILFIPLAHADDTADQIQQLKYEILQIAFDAQGTYDSDDNNPEVRQKLDPLVDQLVALAPKRTEQQKLVDVIGTWYQVWADGPGGQPGQGALADSIWQVVFPEGYYWNVARDQYGQIKNMGYLRGKFTVGDNALSIEFTKAVTNPTWSFAEPTRQAMLAEFGTYDGNPTTFPPGTSPVGKKGTLANVYVDEDIRIVRGGGGDFGVDNAYLYILERD
ncbi:MAG TPA: PAP/fibrillin family protein [Bdellovibrio sp.]|uniref:PAP/fibrillin family protein n=1 Tax=Bdellovibrio sp. TaxID=28201 RepID=UPI002F08E19C